MIHISNTHAMATVFQVRIAGEDPAYAEQAARAALTVAERLEGLLSRFQEESEVSQLAQLEPGERLRVSEPVFACLEIAHAMQTATRGTFSPTPRALHTQAQPPKWSLDRTCFSICCEAGRLEFDLGAIGKGFALDRMALELAEWSCPAYLLVAGGSSLLAGEPPPGLPGWDTGLGEDHSERRVALAHRALSGSGVAVQGRHILDPRTGAPAMLRERAWALAPSAAVSDALSTACMVLAESEIVMVLERRSDWRVWLMDGGEWRSYGI